MGLTDWVTSRLQQTPRSSGTGGAQSSQGQKVAWADLNSDSEERSCDESTHEGRSTGTRGNITGDVTPFLDGVHDPPRAKAAKTALNDHRVGASERASDPSAKGNTSQNQQQEKSDGVSQREAQDSNSGNAQNPDVFSNPKNSRSKSKAKSAAQADKPSRFGSSVRVLLVGVGEYARAQNSVWESPWGTDPDAMYAEWERRYANAEKTAEEAVQNVLTPEEFAEYKSDTLNEKRKKIALDARKAHLDAITALHPASITPESQIKEAFSKIDPNLRDWAMEHKECWSLEKDRFPKLHIHNVPKQWHGSMFPFDSETSAHGLDFPSRAKIFNKICNLSGGNLNEIQYTTLNPSSAQPTFEEHGKLIKENKDVCKKLNNVNGHTVKRIVFIEHVRDTFQRFIMGAGAHESFDIVWLIGMKPWKVVVPKWIAGDPISPQHQYLTDFKQLMSRDGLVVYCDDRKQYGFKRVMQAHKGVTLSSDEQERVNFLLSHLKQREEGVYHFRLEGETVVAAPHRTSRFADPPRKKITM